jgi:hypothetical protein
MEYIDNEKIKKWFYVTGKGIGGKNDKEQGFAIDNLQ